jgi:glycosyltransferase involved in cell wall biosynthesis
MNIVFVSNILNHHQKHFCEAMLCECQEFHFIATVESSGIGYQDSCEADYVIHFQLEGEKAKAEQLILRADAVIFGDCPNELIELRMKVNMLSFFYSERFFKKGIWRRFIPSLYMKLFERIIKHRNKNMYVLCASAYLPYELSLLGFPIEKCYRWGYFPEAKRYDDIAEIMNKKEHASILWAGRLIDWKHPDDSITVAVRLKKEGYKFNLNIIGDGELRPKLQRMINRYGLSDCVHMLGSLSQEQVRKKMEASEILLFTSDFNEGWGAVLNEAMNSGCAVVASHAIGSVPFLLEDGKNGLIYESGNMGDLVNKVKYLLDNPDRWMMLGKRAYYTIEKEWNATSAARRFVELAQSIIDGDKAPRLFDSGICSKANILGDYWLEKQ